MRSATTNRPATGPASLTISLETIASPTGDILLGTDQQGKVRVLDWVTHVDRMQALVRRQNRGVTVDFRQEPAALAARRALEAYFAGDICAPDGLETATGGTPFQKAVWAGLRQITPGKTLSYQGLAALIGRSKAVRAVGAANGSNPIAIIVPCHRVIGADGSLTGFGGGLDRKAWLLRHEGALL